jgi:hypothetical protein
MKKAGAPIMMKHIASFTVSMIVLGVTTSLILANPIVSGFEYGMKKGWIKPNKRK